MNLNLYRNAHYRLLNDAKKGFKESLKFELSDHAIYEYGVAIDYVLYLPTKRRIDSNNVLTVVDKFFSDCLVEYGIIPDDNYEYIQRTGFHFGGIDTKLKEKRVRIIVTPIRDKQPLSRETVSCTLLRHRLDIDS